MEERGDLYVWVVDGSCIRRHIDEEFANTSQYYHYCYIPENELWIDRGAKSDERRFFIDYLLAEYRLMARDIPYRKALEAADRVQTSGEEFLGHLWSQTPSTVTIYHDADRPSRLLLPITAGNIIGTFVSGGELSLKRGIEGANFDKPSLP